MLSDKMQQALNDQLNAEWYSAYLYVSMAAYFESIGLKGFATWMSVQVQEERAHGEGFYTHVNARRGRVLLKAIDAPPAEWKSPLAAFEHVLDHEQQVTGRINKLVTLAAGENDYASQQFLQWYVSEQVEEEENADQIARQLTLIGDNPHALLMLDRELGTRVFVPPVIPGGGGAPAGGAGAA